MGEAKSAVKSQEKALELARDFIAEARVELARHGFKLRAAYPVGSRGRETTRTRAT